MYEFLNTNLFKYLILPIIFQGVSLLLTILFWKTLNSIDITKSYLYLLIYVSIFAIIEEFIFRYLIQWWIWLFMRQFIEKIAYLKIFWLIPIIISSILFTCIHVNLSLIIFILSVFLWIVYYYYNNIFLNIYLHLINNIIALTLVYYTFSS